MALKPSLPYNTPLIVLTPSYTKAGGVRAKVIPDLSEGFQIFASYKTFGGTERNVDGLYSIEDTADVETWYRPDITSECIVVLADTITTTTPKGAMYEIVNEPENIDRRNQILRFKVKRIKGGA